jgi:hypothetical protein
LRKKDLKIVNVCILHNTRLSKQIWPITFI